MRLCGSGLIVGTVLPPPITSSQPSFISLDWENFEGHYSEIDYPAWEMTEEHRITSASSPNALALGGIREKDEGKDLFVLFEWAPGELFAGVYQVQQVFTQIGGGDNV